MTEKIERLRDKITVLFYDLYRDSSITPEQKVKEFIDIALQAKRTVRMIEQSEGVSKTECAELPLERDKTTQSTCEHQMVASANTGELCKCCKCGEICWLIS